MRPPAGIVLPRLIANIGRGAADAPPELAPMFGGLLTILGVVTGDLDDAVPSRLEEIKEMEELIEEVAVIAPPELAAALRSGLPAAPAAPGDYGIAALDGKLDVLRGLLVDAQRWLEETDYDAAPALLDRYWDFLRRTNARNLVLVKPW